MVKRRERPKPFEAVQVREATGEEVVLSRHTTARAALNAMSFRAFFGNPGVSFKVRDARTGKFVQELAR